MAIIWTAPTARLVLLNSSLNSLANDTTDDGGQTAIDNTTNRYTHADFELHLASVDLSAQTAPCIWVYMLVSIDGGTVFDQFTDATADVDLFPPQSKVICKLDVRNGNGAETKDSICYAVPDIPPEHIKFALHNKTGAALAASGNTFAYRLYSLDA